MSQSEPTKQWKEAPSPDDLTAANAPTVYYDAGRKDYWIQNSRGGWISVNETALRIHLKAAGVSSYAPKRGDLCAMERALVRIRTEFDVAFAGALAGYPIGMTEICGNRILVTSEAKLIQPVEGPWPTIEALLKNLFEDKAYDQRPHVYGWLKVAFEALVAQQRRPGQALVIAGPRKSGKSLFQKLITEILGGRTAKPYRYMTGGTEFNSELCAAEHLMIEDEIASTDMRARRNFGSRIKDFTVNEVQSYHAKNRPAISVTPFWRVSVTLNDEPEDMLILPPMDDSLIDKLILLKAERRPMPMPTGTNAERAAFWKALRSELPAFLSFLTKWAIPEALRCERFGVTHYHHRELLQAIETLAPQTRLLELIDACFWPTVTEEAPIRAKPQKALQMTATELQGELTKPTCLFAGEARSLLSWPQATGTYLGRLAQERPDRVEKARTAGSRKWLFKAPPETGGTAMTP